MPPKKKPAPQTKAGRKPMPPDPLGPPKPTPRPRPGPGPDPIEGSVWVRIGTPVITWRRSALEGETRTEYTIPLSHEVRITRAADELHKFRNKSK